MDEPLLDLRLLVRRPVAMVLAALTLAGVAMAGTGLMVTQYLQSVLGYSPMESALWFAPMGLGVAAGTMLTPAVTRRIPPRAAIAGGLAVSAAGAALVAGAGAGAASGGPWATVAGIAVLAFGTGPLFAHGTHLVVGSVPPERAGSAASTSETANYLGGTLGMALLGTVGAAVYRHHMDGAVLPAGVGEHAEETIAAAAAAARGLPSADAADLLRNAHDAFTGGLTVVAVACAAVFAVLALGAARLLPRDERAAEEEKPADSAREPSPAA
ncbi:MFS transporter [Actinomadura yumaensis]|uniref:MFS transporter n=1 Tax=Actinomadura yumaensis TaxID=111807 RepID=UPI00361764B5